MARIFSKKIDEFHGKLIYEIDHFLEEEDDYHISIKTVCVYYQPSPERLKQADKNTGDISLYKKKILEFYPSCVSKTPSTIVVDECVLTIYPINTIPNADFMKPKYSHIESISLIGFDYGIPESLEEVEDILQYHLPTGFVKDYDYGLGLQYDYRFIINAIEENKKINKLIISKYEKSHIDINNETALRYTLNYSEYETIRRGIYKIARDYQFEARKDKSIFAYNALLNTIDPVQYPEKYRTYKKDTIYKLLSKNDIQQADLSEVDKKEVINLISKNINTLKKDRPKELMKLHDDIELVTLKNLIQIFEEKLSKDLKESHWQNLFNENPFTLNLVFGFPIIKVGERVSVGGKAISGNGEKITDFLVKNNHTNNTALIEIKTPFTELLNKKAYRGNVYAPSKELSGSINQVLDQKYMFQKQIATLKNNSKNEDKELESYSVSCVLIIGKIPEDDDQKKSFELFRGNSKDIEIITFDELLNKLKQLHDFLSSDNQVELN